MKIIVNQYVEQLKNAMAHFYPADGELKKLDIDFVKRLSHIIETHPGINRGQSKFIAKNALLIAGGFDMSAEEKRDILYAALLIQLGKITLPDNLLKKPFYSMSTAEKYRYFRHATDAEDLLKGLSQFAGAISIIRHQYERYNGHGFSDALVGPNIPLGSRILSVVRDYIGYREGSKTGKVIYADAPYTAT